MQGRPRRKLVVRRQTGRKMGVVRKTQRMMAVRGKMERKMERKLAGLGNTGAVEGNMARSMAESGKTKGNLAAWQRLV
jgi:hypothetical protein